MADNSNFVLRWEIDNATAKLATRHIESEVFNEGGFKWTAATDRRDDPDGRSVFDTAEVTLSCDVDHDRAWKCEAEVKMIVFGSDGSDWSFCKKKRICFEDQRISYLHESNLRWKQNPTYWALEECIKNDKIVIEFHINIISSESDPIPSDPSKFAIANNRSDVILLIGDKRLHVSKEYLAIHSPVFETLFFGDFTEKGKEEIEIKDVVFEEFVDLLNAIYPGPAEITHRTVLHILKLSDRFQMKGLVEHSEKHITHSNKFDTMAKLMMADQYRLESLKTRCLLLFKSYTEVVEKMQSYPDYSNFSSDMKAAICDRIAELKP